MKKQSVGRPNGSDAQTKRGNRPPVLSQSKRKGELVELAFAYKATALGFGVAKPYGDSERFDFIVSSGPRLWRVQIKSTYKAGIRGYGIRAYGTTQRGAAMYTPDQIDLIVVYLVPEGIWYIIPIEAIGARSSLYFYPQGSQKGLCRYEKYREAWWLMKSKKKSRAAENPR
jgi:hypothetical protein